jgi:tetratricopeptide (TPR) repeat protein
VLGVALLVLAQVGAATGARPEECAPLVSASATNVWERAKHASLQRYCDRLATAAAKLAAGAGPIEAHEAIVAADEAHKTLPGRAAPAVLRGRAQAALGEWRDAEASMEEALGIDPHAVDDPEALFARARALGRIGRAGEAQAALRSILPRASDLPPAERGRVEIEAALLAEASGPAGLDEAIAALRQATRDAQDALLNLAQLALPLALDRAGEREESRLAATSGAMQKRDPLVVLADARVMETLADVGAEAEGSAIAAFALSERDPAGARALWTKYLAGAGGKGPWAEHAQRKLQGAPRPPKGVK